MHKIEINTIKMMSHNNKSMCIMCMAGIILCSLILAADGARVLSNKKQTSTMGLQVPVTKYWNERRCKTTTEKGEITNWFYIKDSGYFKCTLDVCPPLLITKNLQCYPCCWGKLVGECFFLF